MTVLIGAKSHFSLGESVYDPEKLVKAAKAAGYSGLVVTDSNSIDAMPVMKAKADGIQIGLAAQVHVVDDLTWVAAKRGEPRKAPNPFFMPSLFVRNEDGFRDLVELMTLAHSEGHYCTKPARPQVNLDELLTVVARGNLSMTLGSAYSVLSHRDARDKLRKIASALSASQTLAELVPVNTAYYDQHNARSIKAAEEYEFGAILTRPVLNEMGGVEYRNTMNCVLDHLAVDATFRREPADNLHVLLPTVLHMECGNAADRVGKIIGDTMHALSWFDRACATADDYFDHHPYQWEKMKPSLPSMAANPLNELVSLCKKGWVERLGKPVFGYKPDESELPKYRDRLKYELDTLRKMGFEDYFLLVRYIVDWSRSNGVMTGPGRGSVGGSLVAYLMGITDVDPIRFGLIFERFLNPERIDLPDIDLDFMASRRQEVVQHLSSHFGEENVCNIANYSTIAGAGAIREVSKAFKLQEHQFDCSKLVPKEAGVPVPLEQAVAVVPELEKFALEHPKVWDNAVALQGCFRNYAQHAAGVVVAGEPIIKRAVVKRGSAGAICNWDKRVVEDFGLIKLDVLGLSNLDILRIAREYIEQSTGEVVNYTALPLDDKKVLEAFALGKTYGVFQFESGGMRRLLKDLGSEGDLTFDDITAATALYRPGPMQSGMMDRFVQVKRGYAEAEFPHPLTEDVLSETYSVICYQEQVMKVAQVVSGYTMAEADKLRKIMGKKNKDDMAEQRSKFVDGAAADFYEVELDDGSKVTLMSNKKYEVEEGGFYLIGEIESTGLSLKLPLNAA